MGEGKYGEVSIDRVATVKLAGTKKRLTGRPSSFSEVTADAICELLADGQSLRKICEAPNMPNRATVFRWLASNAEFSDQYARAREAQADALADEILDLADTSRIGVKTTTKPNGDTETVEGDMVERTRLQIDARKWLAAKLKPKVYSEKIQQEHSGSIATPELKLVLHGTAPTPTAN